MDVSNLAIFPNADGSRVPFKVYSSDEIYALEQERIYRGPTWNFLGLEAEIPKPGDFKSSFIGDTPVVMTRAEDGTLAAWVNRCAHRGAMVCRLSARQRPVAQLRLSPMELRHERQPAGGAVPARTKANATGMPEGLRPEKAQPPAVAGGELSWAWCSPASATSVSDSGHVYRAGDAALC